MSQVVTTASRGVAQHAIADGAASHPSRNSEEFGRELVESGDIPGQRRRHGGAIVGPDSSVRLWEQWCPDSRHCRPAHAASPSIPSDENTTIRPPAAAAILFPPMSTM